MQAVHKGKDLTMRSSADSLGFTQQTLNQMELKESSSLFGTDKTGKTWLERLLKSELYGFPQDAEYRAWFLALAKPNAIKQQYDNPENWITREQLFKAVELKWDRILHDRILSHYHTDTEGLANGAKGLVVGQTYVMPVR
jgi:hypothetical protein